MERKKCNFLSNIRRKNGHRNKVKKKVKSKQRVDINKDIKKMEPTLLLVSMAKEVAN